MPNDDLNEFLEAVQIPCDFCEEIMCDGFCQSYLDSQLSPNPLDIPEE